MAAFQWLGGLVVMFVVTLIYLVFSPVITTIYDTTSPLTTNVNATNTMDLVVNVGWQYWPIVMIVGIALFWLAASQKREFDTGGL